MVGGVSHFVRIGWLLLTHARVRHRYVTSLQNMSHYLRSPRVCNQLFTQCMMLLPKIFFVSRFLFGVFEPHLHVISSGYDTVFSTAKTSTLVFKTWVKLVYQAIYKDCFTWATVIKNLRRVVGQVRFRTKSHQIVIKSNHYPNLWATHRIPGVYKEMSSLFADQQRPRL